MASNSDATQLDVTPTLELDLSELPDEVTDYAFDQYEDRVAEVTDQWLPEYFTHDGVKTQYDTQTVGIFKSPVVRALEAAVREKIRDIEREVEHGERDDYTLDDVADIRTTANNIFG